MSLSGCGARRPAVLPTILALLACLAAAGCQQRNLAPDTTVLGECQRQAEEDPKVKDLLLQTLNGVNADPTHFLSCSKCVGSALTPFSVCRSRSFTFGSSSAWRWHSPSTVVSGARLRCWQPAAARQASSARMVGRTAGRRAPQPDRLIQRGSCGAGHPVLDQPARDAVQARQQEIMRLRIAHLRAGEPAHVHQLVRLDGDLLAQRLAVEAQHDVGGERPWLAGMVLHIADDDAGLF